MENTLSGPTGKKHTNTHTNMKTEQDIINEAVLERLLLDHELRRIAYKEKEITLLQKEVEDMKNTLEPEGRMMPKWYGILIKKVDALYTSQTPSSHNY